MEMHGGNIYRVAEETGIPEQNLIDFSASINPLGVPGKVKDAIREALDSLVNYPDPDTTLLRHEIARHYGVDSEGILCGNGSTELIYLIPRALKPRKVMVPAPSFSEYERAVAACGLRVAGYALQVERGFAVDPAGFIEAMQGCDMAFLCNPNNPTGHLLGRPEVLRIAGAAREMKCLLVVDEAFIDFCPGASVIRDVRENPYLAVLRSMTKFYALAGLRIGYGVFHAEMMPRVREYKEPWTVNSLAQKAAVAALDDSAYAHETMRLMEKEKRFLENGFREAGMEFFPSAANYYLLRTDNASGMVSELRRKGVLLRDCSNFKGLDGSYMRVAVKSHRDNEMLIREIACRV
ncbi:MAG: threonine-phosphate decarboxylase [Deferribacteres bacterium]|nr:threonine-phosphate decarboxylase [Deferribacteres bacterium]